MAELTDEILQLKENMQKQGLFLSEQALALFGKYTEFVFRENEKVNLIGKCDRETFARLHLLDSLAPLSAGLILPGSSVIDIGCGAGLPGLPLLFTDSSIKVTLLDSTAKKLGVVERFLNEENINGALTLCARAEECARVAKHHEMYDVALSRAVAAMPVMCELCLPFVKVGGVFIAYKGALAHDEADAAGHAIDALGGRLRQVYRCAPLDGMENHSLIVIDKIKSTDMKYPRRYNQITKAPL